MKVIVGCLVIDNGKLLLVREAKGSEKGKLGFPMGHLEDDETIIDGAIRETYEESGYKVEVKSILPITEVSNNHGRYILIIFGADIVSKDNVMFSDVSEVVWMNVEDVLNLGEDEFRHCSVNKELLKKFLDDQVYSLELLNSSICNMEVNACA